MFMGTLNGMALHNGRYTSTISHLFSLFSIYRSRVYDSLMIFLLVHVCTAQMAEMPQGSRFVYRAVNQTGTSGYIVKVNVLNSLGTNSSEINICERRLGIHEMQIACRHLGYEYLSTYEYAAVNASNTPTANNKSTNCFSSDVTCSGNETSLEECNFTQRAINQSVDTELYLECAKGKPPEEGTVRLIGGSVPYQGYIQLFHNQVWGGICLLYNHFSIDYFPSDAGNTICHQLGFGEMFSSRHQNTDFTIREFSYVHNVDFNCGGEKQSLLECNITDRFNFTGCDPQSRPSLLCIGKPIETLPARLVNGQSPYSGILNIQVNGMWGTVCYIRWDVEDAAVICNQLGYGFPVDIYSRSVALFNVTDDVSDIFLSGVECVGNETSLANCKNDGYGNHDCSHFSDVTVTCWRFNESSFDGAEIVFEPITMDTFDGHLLKVNIPNRQMSGNSKINLCEGTLGIDELQIACRQLGFDYLSTFQFAEVNTTNLDNFIDCFPYNVQCGGNEGKLQECNYTILTHSPKRDTELYVKCASGRPPQEGALQLFGGSTSNVGELRIFHNNVWGGICQTYSRRELYPEVGNIACLELGFGQAFYGQSPDVEIKQHRYLHAIDFSCEGGEDTIAQCNITENEYASFCTPSVGVVTNCLEEKIDMLPVRLVNGSGPSEGIISVFVDGVWGSVCDDNFGFSDSLVVCRQLGYEVPVGINNHIPMRSSIRTDIFLDNVDCRGNEASLIDCQHDGLGMHNCYHWEDASISCLKGENSDEFSATLLQTSVYSASDEGVFLLYYNGRWGTVCYSNGKPTADVACKTLGYEDSRWNNYYFYREDTSLVTASHGQLVCDGSENHLRDCTLLPGETCELENILAMRCSYQLYIPVTDDPTNFEPQPSRWSSGLLLPFGILLVIFTFGYFCAKCCCGDTSNTPARTQNGNVVLISHTPAEQPNQTPTPNDPPPTYDAVSKNPHLFVSPPSALNDGDSQLMTPPPTYDSVSLENLNVDTV